VSRKQAAGEHEASVDMQGMPAGLYYVILKQGGSTLTRKVVRK
jgi:hypothetical protein